MSWQIGTTILGLGLGLVSLVAPMMGLVLPIELLALLFGLGILLVCLWPITSIVNRLVSDHKKRLTVYIRIGCLLVLLGFLYGLYVQNGGGWQYPQLGLYFNGMPLNGQRISIKMEKERESPPVYHISLIDIEVREEGRKMGAHVSTPRWRLSEKDIECLNGCGDGEREPSDAPNYPIVFRGPAFSVDAGGKSFFPHILFRKRGHPATEIRTELELRYGPPDPVQATFTILPYE